MSAPRDRFHACPAGSRRGIDIKRMAGEISKIVLAKFPAHGEDLVQEVLLAIARKNEQPASAFDPTRGKGFSAYVYMVARSKAGHLAGSDARRAHPVVAVEDAALEAFAGSVAPPGGEAASMAPSASTVGELVEQLAGAGERARAAAVSARRRCAEGEARYHDGVSDTLRAVGELLAEAFEDAPILGPMPQRVIALLAGAGRPLTVGQISAALLVAEATVERALRRLGDRVGEGNRGTWRLAWRPSAPRRGAEACRNALTLRLTDDELHALERVAALMRTLPRALAKAYVLERVHGPEHASARLTTAAEAERIRQTLTTSLARFKSTMKQVRAA